MSRLEQKQVNSRKKKKKKRERGIRERGIREKMKRIGNHYRKPSPEAKRIIKRTPKREKRIKQYWKEIIAMRKKKKLFYNRV